jgi:hypothetical protein
VTGGKALAAAGILLICLCGVCAALLEALLVPIYVGTIPVPVAVVLAVLSNIAFPRIAYRIAPRGLAALAPFACWLVVIFIFGIVARPEGDVILPGGSSVQYVSYGVMLGGALAGTLTVVLSVPARSSRGRDDTRSISAGRDPGSPRPAPPGRR